MTVRPPRRPWWKRKRTWAAVALWLVILYPLSQGPVHYVAFRGHQSGWPLWGIYNAAYHPARMVRNSWIGRPFQQPFASYLRWWHRLALDDEVVLD